MEIDAKAALARQEAFFKAMVDRFLCWKLPKDFGPDAGISFKPYGDYGHDDHRWPIGTNLLTAPQAEEMFRHCVPYSCFGLDDCSSEAMAKCPWADRCGK